ncbi:hypothetical protein OG948_38805 (plasmid) [Embleya sp. NBC_00888]|uniref:hypothetical protein n=1 Tax=Embleya sp. NBC_00888 TaxID=2975960 RepID=UPI002F90D249|nr:hypothetical protein OG948_38805 [Embleya sp. NBC_00888]
MVEPDRPSALADAASGSEDDGDDGVGDFVAHPHADFRDGSGSVGAQPCLEHLAFQRDENVAVHHGLPGRGYVGDAGRLERGGRGELPDFQVQPYGSCARAADALLDAGESPLGHHGGPVVLGEPGQQWADRTLVTQVPQHFEGCRTIVLVAQAGDDRVGVCGGSVLDHAVQRLPASGARRAQPTLEDRQHAGVGESPERPHHHGFECRVVGDRVEQGIGKRLRQKCLQRGEAFEGLPPQGVEAFAYLRQGVVPGLCGPTGPRVQKARQAPRPCGHQGVVGLILAAHVSHDEAVDPSAFEVHQVVPALVCYRTAGQRGGAVGSARPSDGGESRGVGAVSGVVADGGSVPRAGHRSRKGPGPCDAE